VSGIRLVVAIVGGVLVVAAVALSAACTFVLRRYDVQSSSMEPALARGDSFWTVHFGTAHPGDIVVITPPPAADLPAAIAHVVVREVAEGGDTVEAKDGQLLVNGAVASEPYLAAGTTTPRIPRTVVPDGTVYVLGDNRVNSQGSRVYGPVAVADVTDRFVRKNPPPTIVVYLFTALVVVAYVLYLDRTRRTVERRKVSSLGPDRVPTPVVDVQASAAAADPKAPAWYPDPAERHEQRWWDGERWSSQARDSGQEVADPLGDDWH
jgi:signal peptidase I